MDATVTPPALATDDDLWAAVVRRDPAADGTFVYAVRTTGVYCRPSCPARRARRENVRFHAHCEDAERAGFRPCLRCRPNERSADAAQLRRIEAACRALDEAETPPTLADLAAQAGLSRFHFHRLFKAHTGLTPKAYASARRAARLRDALPHSARVTDAIYDSGFNSSSRFYSSAPRALGMAPRTFRNRGAQEIIHYAFGRASLGTVLVAATGRGLCAILLGDAQDALLEDLKARFSRATLVAAETDFAATVHAVVALIETPSRGLGLPLDIRGTAFQQRVWQALRAIPPGGTVSYGELAARIDAPRASRAVARACGANPLAVAVPCHRVIGAHGELAGYRWGVARKRQLLAREAGETVEG
ncbi:MAG: bifunctional DNA-binding transcriptional regulator/O6-methylguanine-DNA methyltransferase Ada [Gammaproteobacteria bacterium]